MHNQAVERVTDADAACLGVADHAGRHPGIAGRVEICVDDAGAGLDHRHFGLLADGLNQPLRTARNQHVDKADRVHQGFGRLVARRQQLHRVGVNPVAPEHVADYLHKLPVAVVGIATALEHGHVARAYAERRHVDRHVGPGLVDDADHAERHAHFPEVQPVVGRMAFHHFAHRGFERRHLAHVGGNGGYAVAGQQQAVVERAGLVHPRQIARIGRYNGVGLGDQRVGQVVEDGLRLLRADGHGVARSLPGRLEI